MNYYIGIDLGTSAMKLLLILLYSGSEGINRSKLLDDLFADTALDVSSDISVLQTLLAQEGLTGDGFKTK